MHYTKEKTFHAVKAGKQWRINRDSLFEFAGIEPAQAEESGLDAMITVNQAAELLKVCPRTVLRMCKESAAANG